MIQTSLPLPEQEIQAFCDRWQIIELALFGSILRNDFRLNSDIDILLTLPARLRAGILLSQDLTAVSG